MIRNACAGMAAVLLAAVAVLAGGCGDNGGSNESSPESDQSISQTVDTDFPRPSNRSMRALIGNLHRGPELAPSVPVLDPGENRFGFALFDRGNRQIGGLEVALYVSAGIDETARGPFLAHYERIDVKPQFRSQTSAQDPDSAKSLYVTNLRFNRKGTYVVVAVTKLNGRLVGALQEVKVNGRDTVPGPGDRAVRVHTPTKTSVGGNVAEIDTRVPPDTMHDVDLADALDRHRPTVLLFSTPALCQSRVCGPVTDVAEQVKSEFQGKADFIHMEIYVDNDLNKGPRPQFTEWGLHEEPILFTIGRDGRIAERIQGAFSADELRAAVRRVTR